MNGLTIDGPRLLRDGAEHRVVSGAVHYFRVHPELWRDRLTRLRAMGCNTVETYVAWNFHQPRPDAAPAFDGWRDLGAFLATAADLGLDAVVRPGPFICAEWDFGGLPAWLLADENLRLRCQDPAYLAAVDAWFDALIPVIAEHQVSRGGPVVAVQVENEYGSYGNDRGYLEHLERGLVARGIDCLLFTSDGPTQRMLSGGTLPGTWATTNFGSRPGEAFAESRRFRADAPQMCMEFWNGWFDHWGEPHHVRDVDDAAKALDGILAEGASVNVYMAHGGTNFGWWAGANHADALAGGVGYQPTVTSYDYDAPIGEAGELTAKFHAFREVIGRYVALPSEAELPAPLPRVAPQTVVARPVAALRDHLAALSGGEVHRRPTPEPMEKLGHTQGLVHYRTRVAGPAEKLTAHFDGVHDLAQVFGDGRLLGTIERDDAERRLVLDVPDAGLDLEVLVEPFGRVNFGPHVVDRKGLIGGVRTDYQHLFGWEITVLPLEDAGVLLDALADGLPDAESLTDTEGPLFLRTSVDLPEPADAFIAIPDGTRGLVWLNGFLLGRFWERGPQRTLYAPAPLWRGGANDLVILETDTSASRPAERVVEIRDEPDLGPLAPPMFYT